MKVEEKAEVEVVAEVAALKVEEEAEVEVVVVVEITINATTVMLTILSAIVQLTRKKEVNCGVITVVLEVMMMECVLNYIQTEKDSE